jgi:hypothetical protein
LFETARHPAKSLQGFENGRDSGVGHEVAAFGVGGVLMVLRNEVHPIGQSRSPPAHPVLEDVGIGAFRATASVVGLLGTTFWTSSAARFSAAATSDSLIAVDLGVPGR